MEVHGYKVFNYDWTCSPNGNSKQYTCPGKFEEDVDVSVCHQGMHFCRRAVDCFNYYSFNPQNKVAEVIAYGKISENGDKCCTDKLQIVREVPWSELLEIVNTGSGCTGYRNSGNRNSGNWNQCEYSNGCFNTESPKIFLFNQLSEWTFSDWVRSRVRDILFAMPAAHQYVHLIEMSEEEKRACPNAETTIGYLKKLDDNSLQRKRQEWYDGLSEEDKKEIKNLPNFDRGIFKKITGIDVG